MLSMMLGIKEVLDGWTSVLRKTNDHQCWTCLVSQPNAGRAW